jgi:hypothetical protein
MDPLNTICLMEESKSKRPDVKSSLRLPPFDHSLSEDEEVVLKFIELIQAKFDKGLLSIQGKEKTMLANAITYPGLYIGSITSMATFVFLRKAPLHIMNRYIIPAYNTSSFSVKPNNTAAQPTKFAEPWLLRPVTILIDAALSTMAGLTAWISFTDKQRLYDTMAEIPLLQGRSHLSDALCDDFIHLYHHDIPPSFWTDNEDDILTTITRVVQNCEKRRAFEKKIQQGQDPFLVDNYSMDQRESSGSDFVSLPTQVPLDIFEQIQDETVYIEDVMDWAEVDDIDDDNHN